MTVIAFACCGVAGLALYLVLRRQHASRVPLSPFYREILDYATCMIATHDGLAIMVVDERTFGARTEQIDGQHLAMIRNGLREAAVEDGRALRSAQDVALADLVGRIR